MYLFSVVDGGIVLHLRACLAAWAAAEDHRACLLGAYNTRVSRVTEALERLLDALSTEARARSEKGQAQRSDSSPDVLRTFQDLTYRLAEMYDFLQRLPGNLDAKTTNKPAVREFRAAIRGAARHACLICNKIKHNNFLLSRVDNYYDAGFYVEGFVLLSRGRDASVKISPELHDTHHPGMSFNLGIRSLAFDFLRADIAAGRLCSALGAGETEFSDPDLFNVLRLLNSRPEIGLRFERARSIRTMWERSGNCVVGMKTRDLPFLGSNVQVIQTMSGDGYTRSFPLAG